MVRVLHLALALAGFLLTAGATGSRLEWPGGAGVAEKWRFFREHADEYEVVLLGSSRLYRSFDPRAMEGVWKRAGQSARAFNLGAPGMGRFEADYLAGELLALEPARLRLLVLELWRWDPDEMRRNELSARAVHWHTPRLTWRALESTLRFPGLGPRKRLRLVQAHLVHGARRLASFGRAPEFLAGLRREPDPVAMEAARRSRGYRALEAEPFGSIRERRELFVEEAGRFEAAMLERHAKARALDPLEQVHWDALVARIRDFRAAGVRVVLVVPPGPWAPPDELPLDPAPPLVAYSDRDRYPELYSEEGRFDRFHVTAQVAEELSRDLARRLLPHLMRR